MAVAASRVERCECGGCVSRRLILASHPASIPPDTVVCEQVDAQEEYRLRVHMAPQHAATRVAAIAFSAFAHHTSLSFCLCVCFSLFVKEREKV